MILVTVGSAPHPFPRLVSAADQLAAQYGQEVIIQHGFTNVALQHAKGFDFVSYEKMLELFQKADVIISHASAGPILFAERFQKPLILFPRSGDAGEHVDNHQIDFAKALQREGSTFEIVFEEKKLKEALEKTLLKKGGIVISHPREAVVEEIQKYLKLVEQRKAKRLKSSGWRKLKELLYYLRVYRFLSSLWNHTFWVLRRGYQPKDFWNLWSGHYIKEKARGVIGPSHAWLLEKIQGYSGGKVLEAGCGYGRTLEFLQQKTSESVSLWGVDISFSMLTYAREHVPAELVSRLICSDMNRLPFADQTFDVVFTRGALMHCPENNLEKVLSELERVSKGEIVLVEEAFWEEGAAPDKTFSLNPYTFIHNYSKVLAQNGWQVQEQSFLDEGMVVLTCLVCRKAAKAALRASDKTSEYLSR